MANKVKVIHLEPIAMYEQAIADYTQALLTDPNNLHYLHNRGICYQRLHEYQKAVEDFTQ
jgi:tetratricopeptide (TPR) repeat protein